MTHLLETVNRFVWGVPALLLILGVGIYLTIRTGFGQFRLFPKAIRQLCNSFRKKKQIKKFPPGRRYVPPWQQR